MVPRSRCRRGRGREGARPRRPRGGAAGRRHARAARGRRASGRARARDLAPLRGVPALARPGARGAVRPATACLRRIYQRGRMRTTELGGTGMEITRVGFGAWAIGGRRVRLGLGRPGRRGVDRRDPPRARARRQLDRHRGPVRLRPLRAGRRPRARGSRRAARRLHQGRPAGGPEPDDGADAQARLAPARVRGEPAPARGRRDRPLPDPLADPGRGDRGGLDDARRAEGRGPRPPHRRLELRRRPAPPRAGDRAGRDAAAAVLAARPRGRSRRSCRSASRRGSA